MATCFNAQCRNSVNRNRHDALNVFPGSARPLVDAAYEWHNFISCGWLMLRTLICNPSISALSLTVKLQRRKFYKNHGLSNNWHENIFFLDDVIKATNPPSPFVITCHHWVDPPSPLRDDVIYGRPLPQTGFPNKQKQTDSE